MVRSRHVQLKLALIPYPLLPSKEKESQKVSKSLSQSGRGI